MAPSAQSVKTVTDHFASQGVSLQPMAGHGDWMSFDTTVAQAGRLFNTSFSTYHHVDSGTTRVRTLAYSVPAHLKEHIELVHPMTTYVTSTVLIRQPILMAAIVVLPLRTLVSQPLAIPNPFLVAGHPTRASTRHATKRSRPHVCNKSTASQQTQPCHPEILS
jgi:hypothetical protein